MSLARMAALALSVAAVLASTSALASDPQDVVRQLYAEPSSAFGGPGSQQILASDLAGAMQSRAARTSGASPVDFDFRYGSNQTEISGFMLLPQVDNDEAKVVAVFKNFGKPESVDWSLCRTAGGDWRIADASSNTGPQAWDLRQIVGLHPSPVSC